MLENNKFSYKAKRNKIIEASPQEVKLLVQPLVDDSESVVRQKPHYPKLNSAIGLAPDQDDLFSNIYGSDIHENFGIAEALNRNKAEFPDAGSIASEKCGSLTSKQNSAEPDDNIIYHSDIMGQPKKENSTLDRINFRNLDSISSEMRAFKSSTNFEIFSASQNVLAKDETLIRAQVEDFINALFSVYLKPEKTVMQGNIARKQHEKMKKEVLTTFSKQAENVIGKRLSDFENHVERELILQDKSFKKMVENCKSLYRREVLEYLHYEKYRYHEKLNELLDSKIYLENQKESLRKGYVNELERLNEQNRLIQGI